MNSRKVYWVVMGMVAGLVFLGTMRIGNFTGSGAAGTGTEFLSYMPYICIAATPTPAGTTPSLPDLYPNDYVVTYAGCPWGSPGNIRVPVKNIGEADAGHFAVEINRIRTTVNALEAGGYRDASVEFQSGPVGGVDILVDVDQEVKESNEVNNNFRILFTAPPPCETPKPEE